MIGVAVLAVLLLPAVSVNAFAPTEIDPEPEFVLGVGVKTTEYTVDDVVVSVESVPPETVMSPTTKSVDGSDSVNVIVSVWPTLRLPAPARASDTVGDVGSMVTESPLDVVVTPESVERAVTEKVPAVRTLVVQDQAPVVESAVHGLPVAIAPTKSCTEDPPVAVPEKVGVVSLVRSSVVEVPPSLAAARSGVDGVVIVYETVTTPAEVFVVVDVVLVAVGMT